MINRTAVTQTGLRMTLLASAIALPLLLNGCGKDASETSAEKMIEQAAKEQGQDMQVDIDKGKTTIQTTDDEGKAVTYEATENSTTITTAEGNMTMNTGDAAKIPADYPSDAVQYKNLKLTMAMAQEQAFMLSGTTTDSADEVASELASQAKSQGWEAQGTFQQGAMSMQNYGKGDRSMSVTINTEAGQTSVNITVSQ